MALASLIGAWRCGVQAANVDVFADGGRTTDSNGSISVNFDDLEWALERGKFLSQGRLTNINEIIDIVVMKNARFLLATLLLRI